MKSILLSLSFAVQLTLSYGQHLLNPFSGMEDEIINAIPAELKRHASRMIHAGNQPLSRGTESVLDSTYYWLWDTTQHVYIVDSRVYYEYNGQQQLTTIYFEDFEEGEWEISGRTTHTYNPDGLLDNSVLEFGFGGNYIPYARFYYVYDTQQRVIETGYQTYTAGQWKNLISIVDEFDANGNLITKTYRDWMTIAWVNDFRRVYTYDGDHNLLTLTVEDWDSGWVSDEYYTYMYNSEGNLEERRDYLWGISDWSLEARQLFEYDMAGNLLTETTQDHISGDFWFNESRVVMTYDAQNRLLTGTTQLFANNDWENLDQLSYEYDQEDNIISLVTLHWDSVWTAYDSTYYYYSMISSVSENRPGDHTWTIFPNPATETLSVHYADVNDGERSISIHSLQGVLLRNHKFVSANLWEVKVNELPVGAYIISIQSGSGKSSKLFIKK
jgi:hypothetical protein